MPTRLFSLCCIFVFALSGVIRAERVFLPPSPDPAAVLYTATGFFIRHDGTLLTVAHGVSGCRRVYVGSDRRAPTMAELVYMEPKPDVAVLRVPDFSVPRILSLAPLNAPTAELEAFGFSPGDLAGPVNDTSPLLLNDRVLPDEPADLRYVLWLQSRAITHGWSGGPVLNVSNGHVAGMTLSVAHGAQWRPAFDHPEADIAMAVGAGTIDHVLQRAQISPDTAPDPAESVAADAVVRVYCWR
jgi:S1-C subfamily serine protease